MNFMANIKTSDFGIWYMMNSILTGVDENKLFLIGMS